ncbi:MAG: flagellar basal body-associated FliL family protein [Pseudomonadota bacterium]
MSEDAQNAADTADGGAEPKKKKGLLGPLVIGLAAAVVLGGAAAYAVMSGLAPIGPAPQAADGAEKPEAETAAPKEKAAPPVFVAFDPLTVTLTHGGAPRQLRLTLSVETSEEHMKKVEELKPRMLDALNTLLRAMNERELTEPAGLDRLRAQMLRRVRIAADPKAVKDLLVTEFVVF